MDKQSKQVFENFLRKILKELKEINKKLDKAQTDDGDFKTWNSRR